MGDIVLCLLEACSYYILLLIVFKEEDKGLGMQRINNLFLHIIKK